MLLFTTLLTFLLHLCSLVTAADTNAWKSRSIYFALTDRIARSSTDSGGGSCASLGNYCGGTFSGLESKLDYIRNLGFDAIWITPIVANSAGGYHGYWAQDLYAVNSNYGTADDLKRLVNSAHAKGIYVMVDVVTNHMGKGAIANNRPSPLDQASSYHTECSIDYSNQTSIENCRIDVLPDTRTQSAEIRSLYNTWVTWLMNEYQFDGVRIDTVKHVEKDFWPGFVDAIGAYSIGEVWDGSPTYLVEYARLMPGLLDYATYYPMNNFYQQKGSSQALVDMINTISNTFPDPTALGTFLDNHDNPRWLNQKNDQVLLKNALAFVILSRGIPVLYYGTEQGYAGGADPQNREDLWRSGFNTQSTLYQAISRLTAAKKAAGGLAGNDHTHLYVAGNAYAWSRAGGNLIVLTTNGGGGYSGQHCFNSQRANGRWTDVYGSSGTVTADSNGQVCLTVTNGEPIVLVAGTSACPTSVSVSFTHRVTTVVGETIKIVGNTAQLGSWNPTNGLTLSASQYTSSNPVWTISISLASGQAIQYKFVKVSSSGAVTWESGSNRAYTVPTCQASASVNSQWQ